MEKTKGEEGFLELVHGKRKCASDSQVEEAAGCLAQAGQQ